MATNAEIRDWIRANVDPDLPDRGKLPAAAKAAYYEANPDDPGDTPGASELSDEVLLEEEPEIPAETPPVRPTRKAAAARSRATGQTRTDQFIGKLLGSGGKPKAKGKPKPRMALDKFVSRWYGTLGRVVAPVSQGAARCVQVQAPMAGVLLEDVVKGTVVDRVLQPVARAEDKLDKVFALAGPPVCVIGLETTRAQMQFEYAQHGAVPPQLQMRHAMLMGGLRESLRISLEVTEQYAEQIAQRAAADAKMDAELDRLIAYILGDVLPGQAEEAAPEPEMAGV